MGGLLSAEHTEFTWNQKTWEDKLIQVEAIPPPEAGVGGGGGSRRRSAGVSHAADPASSPAGGTSPALEPQ